MRLERLSGQVDELKRQLRRKWSKLTHSDLERLDFDVDRLTQVVAKRYEIPAQEARAQVEEFVAHVGATFREASQFFGDAARDLWRNGRAQVMDAMHAGSERASELWHRGRDRAGDFWHKASGTVQQRPWTSLAVVAGLGALIGVLLWRRRE